MVIILKWWQDVKDLTPWHQLQRYKTEESNGLMNWAGSMVTLTKEIVRKKPTSANLDVAEGCIINQSMMKFSNQVEATGLATMCRTCYHLKTWKKINHWLNLKHSRAAWWREQCLTGGIHSLTQISSCFQWLPAPAFFEVQTSESSPICAQINKFGHPQSENFRDLARSNLRWASKFCWKKRMIFGWFFNLKTLGLERSKQKFLSLRDKIMNPPIWDLWSVQSGSPQSETQNLKLPWKSLETAWQIC